MKMTKKLLGWSAGIAVVLAVLIWGYLSWDRTDWPEFPQAANTAPQVVAHSSRDYGWRTGDPIVIDLYIHQMAGTKVDRQSLAVVGDFEIRTQPRTIVVRHQKDGSDLIWLRFTVQSFNVAKSWKLDASMSYRPSTGSDDVTITLPALVLYTSPTYDGRPDIQQGAQKFFHSAVDVTLTALALLLGLAGVIFGIAWHKRLTKPIPAKRAATRLDVVRHNFNVVWPRIMSGYIGAENYEELERNLRWLYGLEPRTQRQIDLLLDVGSHPYYQEAMTIVQLCDKRLYQHEYLSDQEHQQIFDAFQSIFNSKPANWPRKPKRAA